MLKVIALSRLQVKPETLNKYNVPNPGAHLYKETVEEYSDVRIIVMDSISLISEEDAGQVVLVASHGGVSSGEFGTRFRLAVVFYNDAGVGKDKAGIAALAMNEKQQVPAGTFSHDSARIGDVRDTWQNGVISHLNETAKKAGFSEGEAVQVALRRFAQSLASRQ